MSLYKLSIGCLNMEKSTVIDSDTNKVTSPVLESNSPELLPDPKGNNGFEKEEDLKDKKSEVSTDQGKTKKCSGIIFFFQRF